MGRSFGVSAPPTCASVVKRSTIWTISLFTRPAGILPGQRMINGARREASIAVTYVPRQGPLSPSQGCVPSGPLSLVKMTIVLSSILHLSEAVGPIAIPGLARELRVRQRRHVNQRERDVGEKRLPRTLLDKFNGACC